MKKIVSNSPIVKVVLSICIIPCVLFLLLLVLPSPHYTQGFKTLDDIHAYVKTLPENFKLDTDNTITPDFSSYYKSITPTWKSRLKDKINWLLTLIKIKRPPLWSASFFKTQLIQVTAQRQAREFKGNYVCKIIPTLQSKIVVLGNIHGAIHSLARCLERIKELGIIGQDLTVTSPDNFIIFMGNVVDRSPYSMETLSIVMQLIFLNPSNVIYMQGNHEAGTYWQEHTLKSELQTQAAHLSKGVIPLVNEVTNFFNTLPLACYIATLSESGNEFIRISDANRSQNPALQEQSYAKFLTSKILQSFTSFNLKDSDEQSAGENTIDIKVIFEGEKKREKYQPHEGLRLLAPDMGATAWTLLSSPTPVYQKAIKFVHDAFILLTPAKSIDGWRLTLHNRNVLGKEAFKATTFYLLSGAEENKKPQSKQLDVSIITPEEPSKGFELTDTSTIAADIASINKHAHAISERAEAISKKLKSSNVPVTNLELKTPASATAPESANLEQESAFEPIMPQIK